MKFSFRTKLIIAMTLIVTGVTGATLWATQKRVRATYQKLFEEQFTLQINYFTEKRIEQLEAVAAKCETIAKSPALVEAMERESHDKLKSNNEAYDIVDAELKGVERPPSRQQKLEGIREKMKGIGGYSRGKGQPPVGKEKGPSPQGRGQPPPPGPGMGTGMGPWPQNMAAMMLARESLLGEGQTMSLLDAKGRMLLASRQAETFSRFRRPTSNEDRKELQRLFAGREHAEDVSGQEIGYLATDPEARGDAARRKGPNELRELIVTPITLTKEGKAAEHLGSLVIGLPVHDFGEYQMYDFSDKSLRSGIWLAGKIHTKTIPEEARAEVSARVERALETSTRGTAKEAILLNGVPHLLFFKVLNPDSIFPTAAQVCLYSMQEAIQEQSVARNQILGFGGLALLVGVGFILRISHGFSKPVEELARATQRVSDGDFDVKVPVRSRDEIGTLAASFNSMTEELSQKERYKTVLAQVTDREVAEQLISGKMSLGGEVKQVSVLFCDIRGFTALTENMPPAEVITMLNEHMTAMNQIVHKHYGVVDKFVGDLIMAVFGAPKSYGNDALHAVKCALQMIEERRRLNETTKHSFEIGIGVATGEVVAGCMGSADRLNYTVLGERVNLASRLCSKAGSTELLIDETTCNLLPEGFVAEATEPLLFKGFSAPVPAYRLSEMNGGATMETAAVTVPV